MTVILPVSWIGALLAIVGSWDRVLPDHRIPAAIEPVARRARSFWLLATCALVAPCVAAPQFALAIAGPVALMLRAHLAIRRLARPDVWVLADERHVVILCPGAKPIWLRASPRRLAQCAMPRATIVRSQR
jgi:hypothetical protein